MTPTASSTAHSVYATYPPSTLLYPDLTSNPGALSPPISSRTFRYPFAIRPDVYSTMLHVAWPVTISVVYTIAVNYVNGLNKERNYKPWRFSRTNIFYFLVLVHNILLATYSGWTFIGMLLAIQNSWPGWNGEYGLAGAADALCKLHGPRGPGSAATFNTQSGTWSISDISMRLLGGTPDATDVGRIWNEGLAFYGWIFYLSKFYELLDTAIVLTKGKRTSFLQIYHHAGAMFAMWAGIRYMSPPIWMFTFVNSGVHTLMYTYYTLSALNIQVPARLKRTLTILQIFQILFGSTYAFLHLFVAYDVPYYAVYRVVNSLSTALPSAASTAASTASSAISSATQSVDLGAWLKKAALRAAGEEGLAENVRNSKGKTFGIDAIHAANVQKSQEVITHKLSMTRTHCLDTSGEVFAIFINLLYLAPLGYMFIVFFSRYFTDGAKGDPPKREALENAKVSAEQALEGIEQQVKEAMEDRQGGDTEPPPDLKAKLEDAESKVEKATKDLKESTERQAKDASNKASNEFQDLRQRAQQGASAAADKIKSSAPELSGKVKDGAADLSAKTKNAASSAANTGKSFAQAAKDKLSGKSKVANDKAANAGEGPAADEEDNKDGEENDDANQNKDSKKPKQDEKKDVEEEDETGDEAEEDADASAYEANPDLPKTEDEIKAEAEMQPDGK